MFAWEACLLGRLPPLPLAFFVAPIPPTPFPGGEGGDQGYFMQGASPLASPALNRLWHLQTLPCRYPGTELLAAQAEPEKQAPGGGLPPTLPVDTAAVMFAWAACLLGRLPAPPLVLILPPSPKGKDIPPTRARRTLFPGGEGGDSKIILPGATAPAPRHLTVCGIYRPCHAGTPALNRLRHRLNLRSRHPARACPRRCRLPLSCRCPAAEPGRH